MLQEVQITTELVQPEAVDGMSRFGTRVSSSDSGTLMSIPLHISMYDASGDGALIEWYGDKVGGTGYLFINFFLSPRNTVELGLAGCCAHI